MFGWGRGREGRIEPQTRGWRSLGRQMICSGRGGGWCPESSGDWPKVTQCPEEGARGLALSRLLDSDPSLHHQCLHPCGEHLFSPMPGCWTPSLLSTGGAWPSPPSWSGQGPAAGHAQDRGAFFQTVTELRGGQRHGLHQATAAWGILQPQSPTGEARPPVRVGERSGHHKTCCRKGGSTLAWPVLFPEAPHILW